MPAAIYRRGRTLGPGWPTRLAPPIGPTATAARAPPAEQVAPLAEQRAPARGGDAGAAGDDYGRVLEVDRGLADLAAQDLEDQIRRFECRGDLLDHALAACVGGGLAHDAFPDR